MSPVFDCTTDHGRADAIPKAAAGVRGGSLVVLPTDTLYGIGADAFSATAVRALLAAKGRGTDMPPPVLVPDARTDRNERCAPMRGSNLIWTIVGVLLIIALLIFILGRV